jgi:hypothetical protein
MTRTSSESALVVSAATDSLLARGRGGEKKFAILQIPQTLLSLQYTAIATLWPSTSAAIRARALDVNAFLDRRVKIYYIDTHRLTELCDTEGATKYPLTQNNYKTQQQKDATDTCESPQQQRRGTRAKVR